MGNSEYGYVIAALGVAAAANIGMAIAVGKQRKKIGLKYPKVYAEGDTPEENKFNCCQRAHQNHVESAPHIMLLMAAVGAQKPISAASLGMVYTLGRILFFKGYSSGDPAKRGPGALVSFAATLGLLGSALYSGLQAAGVV